MLGKLNSARREMITAGAQKEESASVPKAIDCFARAVRTMRRSKGVLQRLLRGIIKSIGTKDSRLVVLTSSSSTSIARQCPRKCSGASLPPPSPSILLSLPRQRRDEVLRGGCALTSRSLNTYSQPHVRQNSCRTFSTGYTPLTDESDETNVSNSTAGHEQSATGPRIVMSPSTPRTYEANDTRISEGNGPIPRLKDVDELHSRYYEHQHAGLALRARKTKARWSMFTRFEPDAWASILHLLDEATPSNVEVHIKRTEVVRLPEGVVGAFSASRHAAILEIMQRTGCHVQTTAEFSVVGMSHAFTGLALHGTPEQNIKAWKLLPGYIEIVRGGVQGKVSLTERDLHRKSEDTETAKLEGHHQALRLRTPGLGSFASAPGDGLVQVPIRPVWSEKRSTKGAYVRFDAKPASIQSIADFTAVVLDMIRRSSRLIRRKEFAEGEDSSSESHVDKVVTQLVALFSDENVTKFASDETVEAALRFVIKHSNLAAYWKLYEALERGRYRFTTKNFNVLLDVNARMGDVNNFHKVIKLMLQKGSVPDGMTWSHFHELVQQRFPQHVDTVLRAMRHKGFFADTRVLRDVIKTRVSGDLTQHLAKDGDLAGFLADYNDRLSKDYGRTGYHWLTQQVLTRMIKVLLACGRVQDSLRLLDVHRLASDPRSRVADIYTLNTFLSSAAKDDDPEFAVAIVKRFRIGIDGAIKPDEFTMNVLFSIAWRRRYFNMIRVIWRYACMAGTVNYEMQWAMQSSLLTFSPTAARDNLDLTRGELWKAFAAKFAVGVDYDMMPGPHIPCTVPEERILPELQNRLIQLAYQEPLEKGSEASKERRAELMRYRDQDFKEAGKCMPIVPLMDVLERAWQKDLRWKDRHLGLPSGMNAEWSGGSVFREMLLNGIRVPVCPGDYTTPQTTEVPWKLNRIWEPEPDDDADKEETMTAERT